MRADLMFPDFMFGPFASLHRKTMKEAKRWARAWQEAEVLADSPLLKVEPGTVLFMDHVTDLDRHTPQWRPYFVRRLFSATLEVLEWKDATRVRDSLEEQTLRYPWGALDAVVGQAASNSIAVVSKRVDALLTFWSELETLRYVGRRSARVLSFDELIAESFASMCRMWLGHEPTATADDLRAAKAAMSAATEQRVQERVLDELLRAATINKRIKHRDRLSDRVWVAEHVGEVDQATREGLATGHDILRALYILDDLAKGS